jgi:hypothetical protein
MLEVERLRAALQRVQEERDRARVETFEERATTEAALSLLKRCHDLVRDAFLCSSGEARESTKALLDDLSTFIQFKPPSLPR